MDFLAIKKPSLYQNKEFSTLGHYIPDIYRVKGIKYESACRKGFIKNVDGTGFVQPMKK
ncbi:MAG: hypothetical protein KKF44_10705 [Nanoarchaeota archaeon]|nr:hypothetical protein [Nanoarchaeota archaeon]